MRGSELLLRKSPISPVGISCSDGMIKAEYGRVRKLGNACGDAISSK
jgi:hypothetical protein